MSFDDIDENDHDDGVIGFGKDEDMTPIGMALIGSDGLLEKCSKFIVSIFFKKDME